MQIRQHTGWLVVIIVAILAGCVSAPHIPENARTFDGEPAIVEELGGGETLVAVDATSNEEWTYIDLDGERVVIVDDPFAESSWDLAFQRYRVKANGGASGNGEVAVAALGTDDFYQTVDIESVEWLTDSGSARGKYAFTAEGAWYQYRMRSHSLESREDVKLVRSTDGVVYRLQMLTYYDRFLIAGYPTFRYVRQ